METYVGSVSIGIKNSQYKLKDLAEILHSQIIFVNLNIKIIMHFSMKCLKLYNCIPIYYIYFLFVDIKLDMIHRRYMKKYKQLIHALYVLIK